MNDISIIILAAGKGTRMGGDLPKVLSPLKETTMIEYLVSRLEALGLSSKPVVVVGYRADLVKEKLGDHASYALQAEQLGTGHAVMSAKEAVGDAKHVLILYGDMPLIKIETVQALFAAHHAQPGSFTMASVTAQDFDGWREAFSKYGRIIRNAAGEVLKIVESKDATEADLAVTEVSPGLFVIDTAWMWPRLESLGNNNAQKEYYLTDLISQAVRDNKKIITVPMSEQEGLGANTPEQLKVLEQFA